MSMIRLSIKPLTSTIPAEHSDLHCRCRWARESCQKLYEKASQKVFFFHNTVSLLQ